EQFLVPKTQSERQVRDGRRLGLVERFFAQRDRGFALRQFFRSGREDGRSHEDRQCKTIMLWHVHADILTGFWRRHNSPRLTAAILQGGDRGRTLKSRLCAYFFTSADRLRPDAR